MGSHTAHVGYIVDQSGLPVDEVIAMVYRAPHSYTAEDSVEISCHGGLLVTRKVLEAILGSDCRLAEPGEFTKRAFLNGRIDLSQAEAVADLIYSRSEASHRTSMQQLSGRLSEEINRIRNELIETASLLELELDFAEEDIELANKGEITRRLTSATEGLDRLIDSYTYGRIYREGVKVVISGRPNVGKSSLLNALLNENRAIVTESPGTTRDTIEESIAISGILYRLVDTAGLCETIDVAEKEGVKRAESQIASADLIIFVLDASQLVDNSDLALIDSIRSQVGNLEGRCILVLNKLDLLKNGHDLGAYLPGSLVNLNVVKISALTHVGLDDLRKALLEKAISASPAPADSSLTVTNARHKKALAMAVSHLRLSVNSLEEGQSSEFICIDVRVALDYLGEIVGVVTTEDILKNVFEKFCVGK